MIIELLSYLLVFLASFFNSLMDCCENENFNQSRLKKWDKRFWYKRESWKYCKKILGYRFDAWHLNKTLMVICLAFAVVFCPRHQWWVIISSIGAVWNFGFILFYHVILGCK